MDRSQAARLLGVPEGADPALVRRAYRTWARMAHPDVGGDPQHFALLVSARQVLLRSASPEYPAMPPAPPRLRLSEVVYLPSTWPALTIGGVLCLMLVTLPLLGAGLALSALIAGVAASAWSWWAMCSSLRIEADAGHRITMLALTWLPLTAAQVAMSAVLGIALIETLPLLVLPFVAVVAFVNAGAGLWRPAR